MTSCFEKPSVLIVGAGEFGAATAVELLRSGNYSTVTIIDRAPEIPAMDAASTDINKVVRFDYTDPDYAVLAREAVNRWRQPKWKGIYNESGYMVRALTHPNSQKTYENAKALEPQIELLTTPEQVRAKLSPSGRAVIGDVALHTKSYYNPAGGWVHASGAVGKLYEEINARGAKIIPNAEMESLILTEDGSDVRGVKCTDGREFYGDKFVMALGSWTGGHPALKDIFPPGLLVPTGQTVAAVQLTKEEYEKYKDTPTISNLDGTGYYSFPPNPDGLMKFALHSHGYTVDNAIPRTALDKEAVAYTENKKVGWIPKQSFDIMRQKFGEIFPKLAEKPMAYTRMCWYSDTPDSNFVIDFAPQYKSVLIASGGAGHGFKFLTVIGECIHSRLENRLPPHLTQKWRINRPLPEYDDDRHGMLRQPLVLDHLTTQRDLGPATLQAKL